MAFAPGRAGRVNAKGYCSAQLNRGIGSRTTPGCVMSVRAVCRFVNDQEEMAAGFVQPESTQRSASRAYILNRAMCRSTADAERR